MEQGAEQDVDRAGQDIKNAPSDVGSAIGSAAKWIGDKIGGVENEGNRAEQGVQNDYNDTKGDVDRFDSGVQNSYDQGENQGRQQGF